jgi:hypothetical protein
MRAAIRNPFGTSSGSDSDEGGGGASGEPPPSWRSLDISVLSLHNPFESSEDEELGGKRSALQSRSRRNSSSSFIGGGTTLAAAAASTDGHAPLPAVSRLKQLKERQAAERKLAQKRREEEKIRSRVVHGRRGSSMRMSLDDVRGTVTCAALGRCLCVVMSWLCNCCGQGRRCTRKQKAWWLVIITMILTFVTTVFVSLEMYKAGAEPHILAWFSGGVCVVLAVPISVFEIFWHLVYFSNPSLQKYIIRILWMVPIYGIESWFALRNTDHAIYLQAFRDFYEAFVIWSFLQFLCKFLGNHDEEILNLLARKREPAVIKHLPPFCCLRPWRYGSEFFFKCKLGVLQYVVAKIFTTIATVVTANHGVYGEGSFDPRHAYPYLAFIDNCSQLWALYCLAMFYQGLKTELAPIKPFSKFLSVKAIVFFSWWQGFAIQIAVSTGYITHTAFYTRENVATALQNWLICLEMLAFAIAHKYAFSYKEYVDVRDPTAKNFMVALFDSSVPVDFIVDMKTFTHKFESVPGEERLSQKVADGEADGGAAGGAGDGCGGGVESSSLDRMDGGAGDHLTRSIGTPINNVGDQSMFGLSDNDYDDDGFSDSSSDAGSADHFLFGSTSAI